MCSIERALLNVYTYFVYIFIARNAVSVMNLTYSQTSVIKRICSRLNRFLTKKSEILYISDSEHKFEYRPNQKKPSKDEGTIMLHMSAFFTQSLMKLSCCIAFHCFITNFCNIFKNFRIVLYPCFRCFKNKTYKMFTFCFVFSSS